MLERHSTNCTALSEDCFSCHFISLNGTKPEAYRKMFSSSVVSVTGTSIEEDDACP